MTDQAEFICFEVHIWPQTIGKRIVVSTLKFPEIHWIRNLFKRTMLAGQKWSSGFHLCWWHPGYVKNKAGLWKISRCVEDWFQDKKLEKPKHILGVRVEFVKNGISLSQRQYIEEIVRTFSSHKGNQFYTPMEPHSTPRKFLVSEDEKFDPRLYRHLIGSLMQLET